MAPFPAASGAALANPFPTLNTNATPTSGTEGWLYGWGFDPLIDPWNRTTPPIPGRFNAIHMCLIPKGPHRGKVVVWNRYPVLLRPGTQHDALNRVWVMQAWSIVDPTALPGQVRFRNFLLPLQPLTPQPSAPPGTDVDAGTDQLVSDLFCTGQAWDAEGNLVVAGGATFQSRLKGNYPFGSWQVAFTEVGAKFLFSFDPALPSQTFPLPGSSGSLYTNELGAWTRGTDLHTDRYYPTVSISQRLTRLPTNAEVAMIAGGTDPLSPPASTPANHYETWTPNGNTFGQDSPTVLPGPGTLASAPGTDRFEQYPRIHLLSDAKMFMSGPSFRSAKINLDTNLGGTWDVTAGQGGTNWARGRDDGSSVFFARVGAFQDVVVRLCGADDVEGATDRSELLFASALPIAPAISTSWFPMGNVPGGKRQYTNAVILPDASILVIGGSDGAPSPTARLSMAVYRNNAWSFVTPELPTKRMYHTTAVLLPDGRVLIGGGEGRTDRTGSVGTDYDIFSPHYLQGNPPRPEILSVTGPGVVTDIVGGQVTYRIPNGATNVLCRCDLTSLEALDQITKLVLLAPGAMTHHSDMSARFVELPSVVVRANEQVFTMPANTVVPRGHYMLFALKNNVIPSVAAWVKVF